MTKWLIFLISIVISNIYSSNTLAQEVPNIAESSVVSDNTNTTSTPNTGTPSNLNTNTINQGVSAFSSSFSGYSSYGSQCGLSISGGYINNGDQNSYQIVTTFNTNPCTNQSDLENIRQNNENKREVFRANANIITACINARIEAVKNRVNPDTICKLDNFQMPRTP
ncbi:hypothetical protein [Trichormus sp. NMC-1]|uniref:hypothetical protein n=1 Tax=Trichormus sp. NMC-1 TaxID=1853259 RepID=UPI0008DC08A9|nr:hypothetical protein [Trichormus sp. NMC-1]